MKELTITLELYVEDEKQYLYISDDGSSGCEYLIENLDEIGTYVNNYIKESEE